MRLNFVAMDRALLALAILLAIIFYSLDSALAFVLSDRASASILAGLIATPALASGTNPDASPIAATAQPKYLLFYITGASPEVPLGHLAAPDPEAQTEKAVDRMLAVIGERGDHIHTQLGFSAGPLSFDLTDAQLRTLIANCFAVAEAKDVAVAFHIDNSMFWNRRKDLWSDNNNVEWIDWNGTTVPHRIIGWVANGAPVLAPPMCYNCPAITAAATHLARDVIGAEIKKGIDHLAKIGKPYLFAGVMAGWETRMQDQFGDHGRHDYAIYHALHNLGYSAQNPPKDFDKAVAGVIRDWIVLWARGLEEAGIPESNVYTHLAFTGDPPRVAPFHNQLGDYFRDSVPIAPAFNRYSRPGFSVYSADSFPGLYKVLARYPATPWGVAEGTNVNLSNSFFGGPRPSKYTMENYLGRAFNHGAVFVNVFGAFSDAAHDRQFAQAGGSADAVAAYRKFLRDAQLTEEAGPPDSSAGSLFPPHSAAPAHDLFSKVQRIQANVINWVRRHPDQQPVIRSLIPKLDAAMKAGDNSEAERVADRILAIIQPPPR